MVGSLSDNPFAVLTAVVAPAILTNACSVLSLGVGNRIARVVDRTRAIVLELNSLPADSHDYQWRVRQLEKLRVRGNLLLQSLRLFYAGLGCFAASALLSVIGASLAYYEMHRIFQAFAIVALGTGVVAVGALVFGCAIMVREITIAVTSVKEEVGIAVDRFGIKQT
ncbi:MAG TPA: DUF2721 domain-containing protein [Terriglobales bacterium]|nr:DUF2721 domain-containing protein [Terriglobales bacterium]